MAKKDRKITKKRPKSSTIKPLATISFLCHVWKSTVCCHKISTSPIREKGCRVATQSLQLNYRANLKLFGQMWNNSGTESRWRPIFLETTLILREKREKLYVWKCFGSNIRADSSCPPKLLCSPMDIPPLPFHDEIRSFSF